jgi:RNA binding exosome subunit
VRQQTVISSEQAMAALEEIESILGPSVSARIFVDIEEDYFGNELDILDAMMTRQDLVEWAFSAVLGEPGRSVFEQALKNARVKVQHPR